MNDLPVSVLTKKQTRVFQKTVNNEHWIVTVRHDDECNNGHNSFAITADVYLANKPRTDRNWLMGGCCHEGIAEHFPELAPLIDWHLCSTDEPLHYVANTLYHARDTDHNGRRKGEPTNPKTVLQFGDFPIPYVGPSAFIAWLQKLENYDLQIMQVEHKGNSKPGSYQYKPKFTFLPYAGDTWHLCPFDTEQEAIQFRNALQWAPVRFITIYQDVAEGKEPDLEAARHSAIWPDATLEQLQDRNLLLARLPALMLQFKAAVESLGMVY